MAEEIRILTLWQPWASLIAHGLKRCETRSWGTTYRGKLAIHAAKRPIKREETLPILYATGGGGVPKPELDKLFHLLEEPGLPLGTIVAIADLGNCREMYNKPMASRVSSSSAQYINIASQTWLERTVGNWQPGRFAWELHSIRPLDEPILYKGAQGLKTIDDAAVLTAIAARLGRVV